MAIAIIVLSLVISVFEPVVAIAQGEDAPGRGLSEAPAAAPVAPPAEVSVPPTVAPAPPTAVPVPPTAVPVPPTAVPVPPTAVPTDIPVVPTAVPPTQVPAPAPTAVPTAVPTIEPTAVPTATVVPTQAPKVWVNNDSMRVTDGVTSHTVQQGGSATVSISYNVTTPRTGTTVHARLTGAGEGWTISSPIMADSDASATSAAWTQTSTLQPETSFNLPIIITAPATVAQDHSVSLQLWSTAAGEKGQETGVAKTDTRVASIKVLAPLPTPVPTEIPTHEPTDEATATPGTLPLEGRPPAATPSPADKISGEAQASLTANAQSTESCEINSSGAYYTCTIFESGKNAKPVDISKVQKSGDYTCTWSLTDDFKKTDGCANTSGYGNSGNWNGKLYVKISSSNPGDIYMTFDVTVDGSVTTYVIGTAPVTTPTPMPSPTPTPSPTPVPPTKDNLKLECESTTDSLVRSTAADVTCKVSSNGMQEGTEVEISKLQITVPEGVDLTWNQETVPSPHTVTPEGAVVSQDVSFDILFRLTQTTCAMSASDLIVNTWFTYEGAESDGPFTEIALTGQTVFDPLSVALDGTVDFGTMTWDGERYVSLTGDGVGNGSSIASTTLTVSREGDCGSPKSETIQVSTTASVSQPALQPEYIGAQIDDGSEISSVEGSNLILVSPEFLGDEEVELTFTLTPGDNVPPDEYTDMSINTNVVIVIAQ